MPSTSAAERTNPILDGWYADPQIRQYGSDYWIFPTYSHDFREQTFIDVFSSPDLKTWTKHPHAVDAKDFTWVRGAMWAPVALEICWRACKAKERKACYDECNSKWKAVCGKSARMV